MMEREFLDRLHGLLEIVAMQLAVTVSAAVLLAGDQDRIMTDDTALRWAHNLWAGARRPPATEDPQ